MPTERKDGHTEWQIGDVTVTRVYGLVGAWIPCIVTKRMLTIPQGERDLAWRSLGAAERECARRNASEPLGVRLSDLVAAFECDAQGRVGLVFARPRRTGHSDAGWLLRDGVPFRATWTEIKIDLQCCGVIRTGFSETVENEDGTHSTVHYTLRWRPSPGWRKTELGRWCCFSLENLPENLWLVPEEND